MTTIRLPTALSAVFALLLTATAFAAGGATIRASLTATTHTPKVNVHWPYSVGLTRDGKPAAGRITAQIVDPVGGVHPVQFGRNTKNVTNWRFIGVFRDYVIWPPSSRGVPLRFRVTVTATGFRKVLSYTVTPR
jgi:hypothetical protein